MPTATDKKSFNQGIKSSQTNEGVASWREKDRKNNCVCVWNTCLPRSQFLICRGAQHVTGTVSNEATSDMGSKG